MSVLDVLNSSAYNCVSLTEAIQEVPYQPGRLGQMDLFSFKGVKTTQVMIEEREGVFQLLDYQPRTAPATTSIAPKRTVRSLAIPHIPHNDTIMADDIQDVRAFGSEQQLQSVSTVITERLGEMRGMHELTWEYIRAGAIQGVVRDSTGNLYDLFTEFGMTDVGTDRPTYNFGGTNDIDMAAKVNAAKRTIENALGGKPYQYIHALCADAFFDGLLSDTTMKNAYDRWQDGQWLREDNRGGFVYGGIVWENYRQSATNKEAVAYTQFIPASKAQIFPVGVNQLFRHYGAPGTMIEAVNTVGQPYYAKQERMKFDMGVELHTQSNPLMICTMPRVLLEGTFT